MRIPTSFPNHKPNLQCCSSACESFCLSQCIIYAGSNGWLKIWHISNYLDVFQNVKKCLVLLVVAAIGLAVFEKETRVCLIVGDLTELAVFYLSI